MKTAAVLLSIFGSPIFGLGIERGYEFEGGSLRLLGSSFGAGGNDGTYDYVIIGGGVSGLTVARRLAEDASTSVAVIEAGSFYELDGGNLTQVPGYENQYLEAPPTMDWMIYTTEQKQLGGRSVLYPQGKCFGGSSGRNGMAYQRGTTGAYQMWADEVGDDSFALPNFLKYFQKSVKFTPPNYAKRGGPQVAYNASAYSNSGGPLNVAYWNYYVPVNRFVRKGLEKLGFKETGGIETGSLFGFAQYPSTLNPTAQIRDSSATSFGREIIDQTSVKLYQRSLAKKILFSGKRATAVTVETDSASFTLSANREVIVAAGPLRTPQMLLVSGVGPKKDLQSLKIPVVADLPGVGQTLQDNPAFSIIIASNETTPHQLYSNSTYAEEAKAEYVADQKGPLAAFASNYLAWDSLPRKSHNISKDAEDDLKKFPSDWPDFQYIINTVGTTTNTSSDPFNQIAVVYSILKTTSVGQVTINSTDTADNPLVNTNWISTSTDQQLAVEATKRARELSESFGVKLGDEVLPGPKVKTDAQILKALKGIVSPTHHAAASCRMGKSNDQLAVVDTQGRVRGGITGLRIVDISTFPFLPPGQPMSTVYALAEKFADDIRSGK